MEPTSLTVLEHALDSEITPDMLEGLPERTIRELEERLTDFFRRWSPPPLRLGELRGSVGQQHFKHAHIIGDLALYLDVVVIRDPVEAWLDERKQGAPVGAKELGLCVATLLRYRACIEAGFVLPAPFPPEVSSWGGDGGLGLWEDASALGEDYAFAAAVAPSMLWDGGQRWQVLPGTKEQWERFMDQDADRYLHPDIPADLERELELASGHAQTEAALKLERMLHAAHAGARFIPLSRNDEAAINRGIAAVRAATHGSVHADLHSGVVQRLAAADVPALRGITPELAVSVRREEAFEEWRQTLRSLVLSAQQLEPKARAQLLTDQLDLAARSTQRAVSRSRALTEAFRNEYRRAAVELPLWAATAAYVPAGKVFTAARALGGLALLTTKVLWPAKPEGANAVVIKLVDRTH